MEGSTPVTLEMIASANDRLFEQSWNAVSYHLRKRAQRLAKGNTDKAEEWLSCTAIKALQILRRSPERIHNPQGFLFLVLQHVFLDSIRRSQRENQLFDHTIAADTEHVIAPDTPLERLDHLQRLEEIRRAVSNLPPAQRRLFELMFVAERSYPEIAAELGVSQPLVRKRVQLLRTRLSALTGYLPERSQN